LQAWGIELSDEMLRLALTHRTFAHENDNVPNNERLEFLGDAVLGISVTEQLYTLFPQRSESDTTKMCASAVNMYAHARLSSGPWIGEYIRRGRGDMKTDGQDKDSSLADTVEAILGAVYREHGFAVAKATVLRLFKSMIDKAPTVGLTMDWKTTVQERLREHDLPMPEYKVTSSGPERDKAFFATLLLDGKP